jgi:hypothetical protein
VPEQHDRRLHVPGLAGEGRDDRGEHDEEEDRHEAVEHPGHPRLRERARVGSGLGQDSSCTTWSTQRVSASTSSGLDRREGRDAQLVAAELAVRLGVDDAVRAQHLRHRRGVDARRGRSWR